MTDEHEHEWFEVDDTDDDTVAACECGATMQATRPEGLPGSS